MFRKPLHYEKLKFFYVQNFFFGLSGFVTPVIMVYFLLIGFDYFQNSILFAVWVGSQFLFEIPTGAIADIYGRKLSVFLSYLFCGILAILLAASSSFYILLVLVFLMGGASTLSSGAEMAWMVDHAKKNGFDKDMQKIFSNIQSYTAIGGFIAFGISTYLIYLDVTYVWYLTGIFFIILSFYTLVCGPEGFERKKEITVFSSFRKTYDISKDAISYIKSNMVLLWIFLGTLIAGINSGVGGYAIQPYLLSLGMPAYLFGLLMMFFAFAMIFTPQFSGKLLKLLKTEKNVLVFNMVLSMLLYTSFYFTGSLIVAICLFLVFGSLSGLFLPIIMTYVHRNIPSDIRATTGSVESMLGSLGVVFGLPLGGWILQTLGFGLAFVCGIMLAAVNLCFYLKINDGNKGSKQN
ncbi:MAG: MFS transporter [Candidatus Aenigmarchaeota archaeon]|nr:MFS transporter [Candidatus Aenigmarchaeota archaeon]